MITSPDGRISPTKTFRMVLKRQKEKSDSMTVASVEEAVLKGSLGALGIVVVAQRHARRLDNDLAARIRLIGGQI